MLYTVYAMRVSELLKDWIKFQHDTIGTAWFAQPVWIHVVVGINLFDQGLVVLQNMSSDAM